MSLPIFVSWFFLLVIGIGSLWGFVFLTLLLSGALDNPDINNNKEEKKE